MIIICAPVTDVIWYSYKKKNTQAVQQKKKFTLHFLTTSSFNLEKVKLRFFILIIVLIFIFHTYLGWVFLLFFGGGGSKELHLLFSSTQ